MAYMMFTQNVGRGELCCKVHHGEVTPLVAYSAEDFPETLVVRRSTAHALKLPNSQEVTKEIFHTRYTEALIVLISEDFDISYILQQIMERSRISFTLNYGT